MSKHSKSLATANAITVDPPLAGQWVAVNSPAERVPSHGTDFFGQRYAYDFARLDPSGSSFSQRLLWRQLLLAVRAGDFYAWNQPVFAAFPGKVIAANDGWPDRLLVNSIWELFRANVLQRPPRPEDLRSLLGNYLLIEGEPGVALYAHLRHRSIAVQTGRQVAPQQFLAAVGNSGNSAMPHLHFHVMDGPDPWTAQGVFCDFRNLIVGSNERPEPPVIPNVMSPFQGLSMFDVQTPVSSLDLIE